MNGEMETGHRPAPSLTRGRAGYDAQLVPPTSAAASPASTAARFAAVVRAV